MLIALTRELTPSLATDCELTHLERNPIDLARARDQHARYRRTLSELGARVIHVPSPDELADAVFIEDTLLAFDETLILPRVGAASRRPESDGVRKAVLELGIPVFEMTGRGTLDGGDVLRIGRNGKTVLVGLSTRTTREGIEELASCLQPHGYRVRGIEVPSCLHLKTACSALSDDTVLLNPAWVSPGAFEEYRVLEVDPAEPFAGNSLTIGDTLLYSSFHPRTRERLARRGFEPRILDISELEKAEAGLTCLSVVFDAKPLGRATLGP
jgi:dimethylargininase